jgi:hypothetical protein
LLVNSVSCSAIAVDAINKSTTSRRGLRPEGMTAAVLADALSLTAQIRVLFVAGLWAAPPAEVLAARLEGRPGGSGRGLLGR